MGQKYTYEQVKRDFENVGYTLVSTEYVNSHSYLEYICPVHPEETKKIKYGNFKRGQRCVNCSSKKRGDTFRRTQVEVESEFIKRGYILLDKYDTNDKAMRFFCPKHPNENTMTSFMNLLKGHECRFCAFEKLRGENSPNWKGGASSLKRFFRDCLNEWRVEIILRHNRRCFITGEITRNLEVHHVFPFYKIRDIVLNKLNIDLQGKGERGDIPLHDQEKLRNELTRLHKNICGFPLKRDVHILFHKIYGDDVSYKELKEFKQRYASGEFKEM
ncbi:hypothetical protein EVU96_08690 [Bacillus infantis]|uniref:hypothetical protein n=1 Tax=Bacillus infantis TaxID=324767 RepID=UPI00101DC86F|nr:hypothetical protein [Bacillus infantis]RYI30480.1 hypothetical protein EVU96_08690 [Bacillus infantis]